MILFYFNFKIKRSAFLSLMLEQLAPIIPLNFIDPTKESSVDKNVKFETQFLNKIQIVSYASYPNTIPDP